MSFINTNNILQAGGNAIAQQAISGYEGGTANFTCPSNTSLQSGEITYGEHGRTVKVNIPPKTKSMQITNQTMGRDPIPGIRKRFDAIYSCGEPNTLYQQHVSGFEGETAAFNCPESTSLQNGVITYGEHGRTLQYNIPTKTQSMQITNQNMGGDPIPGIRKRFDASYNCAKDVPKVIIGVNILNDIWYGTKNVENSPNWAKIQGKLKWISYSNGKAYGVNSNDDIYYASNYSAGNWIQVPGKLSRVSFDGYNMIVMGVTSSDQIFYANKNIDSTPNWTQLPGALTDICYSNEQAYGVDRSGNVYYNPDYTTGNWRKVPGGLTQISFDGYNMIAVGVANNGAIYYANKNIDTTPNWTLLPGSLKNVSYSNGQIYGVNSSDMIYYNPDYTTGNWRQVPGGLIQVSFDGGVDCGIQCAPIYDKKYYQKNNTNIGDNPLLHWVNIGIKEGRQAHPEFDPKAYYELNPDLHASLGKDYVKLALHYAKIGKKEGRLALLKTLEYKFGGLLVTDLMCFLDAGNDESFAKDGKSWNDLSGNNNNFTLTKQIVRDRLAIHDVPEIVGPASSKLNISINNNRGSYTINMILQCKKPTTSFAFFIPNSTGDRAIGCHIPWPNNVLYFDNMWWKQSYNRITTPYSDWSKENMVTLVRTTSGTQEIYINGIKVVDGKDVTLAPELSGNVVFNKDNAWIGDLKMLMIYNSGLSAKNIKSMYDWYNQVNIQREKTISTDALKGVSKNFPVKDGVQLILHAGNKLSYAENSLDVRDLSGNGRDFKFKKIPVLKDGAWVNDGTNLLVGPPSSMMGIKPDGNYTIFFRCKTHAIVPNVLLKFFGWMPYNRGIFVHPTWDHNVFFLDQGGCCGPDTRLTYPVASTSGKMTTYTIVRSSKGRGIYINGKLLANINDRGVDMNFSNQPVTILGSNDQIDAGFGTWKGEFSDMIVFNRELDSTELKKVYRFINNPYIIADVDWNGAMQLCLNRGMQLAKKTELCYGGYAVDSTPIENALAPIGDTPGQWINLSTCQVINNTERVAGAHIKPVPLPKQASNITTAFMVSDKIAWFIKDVYVLIYNLETHETSGPTHLNKLLPDLPKPFNSGKIDTAYLTGDKLYLTYEQLCAVYNFKEKKVITNTTEIKQVFIGLKNTFAKGYFDSIADHYTEQGAVYIFKDNKFCYYNLTNNHVGVTHIINSTEGTWNLLPLTFKSGQFSAVIKAGKTFMFFKEDQYFNYMNREHGNLVPDWSGMRPPFIREEQRCVTISKFKESLLEKKEQYRQANPELFKKLTDQYNTLLQEESKHCNFVSMGEIKTRLNKEKHRLTKLVADIGKNRDLQTSTNHNISELKNKIKEIDSQLSTLNVQIIAEQNKKCPTNAKCRNSQKVDESKSKCTADSIRELLLKKGYTIEQINEITKYKPAVNDFDIRTHKNYHSYIDHSKVKSCRKGLATDSAIQKFKQSLLIPDNSIKRDSEESGTYGESGAPGMSGESSRTSGAVGSIGQQSWKIPANEQNTIIQQRANADKFHQELSNANESERKAFEVLKTAIIEYGQPR